jgi:queuine tRNA-ribosyltransferase
MTTPNNLLGKKRNLSQDKKEEDKKINLYHTNKENEEMIKLNEAFIKKARSHPLEIIAPSSPEIYPDEVPLKFEIIKKFNKARASIMTLPHSEVKTPVYMPVGTKGAMKGLLSCDLERMECKLMLSNTYHLALEPGDEFLNKNYGGSEKRGIHNYMKWSNNVLTDSGGFQIVSLSKLSVRSENGVEFVSHIDGDDRKIILTPEKSMSIQNNIGSDIMMAFDDVIRPTSNINEIYDACERSLRWIDRCIQSHKRKKEQNLFGIIQGGLDLNLRKIAVEEMNKRNLPGYAIGGMAGGESKNDFWKVVNTCTDYLPENKPRYLMGVGYPVDLVICSLLGVDMFDCVFATRTARFGTAFTNNGFIKLKNQKFKFDFNPIEIECDCEVCQKYTKSYFYYMFNKNPRAVVLISFHNVYYLLNLMKKVRNSIIQGNVNDFVKDFFMKQFPDSTPSWIRDALKKAGVNIDFIEKVDDRIFYGDNITDEEDE